MDYIELSLPLRPEDGEQRGEIITAWLCDLPFETFVEEDGALMAYAAAEEWDGMAEEVAALMDQLEVKGWSVRQIEREDWNSRWEADFSPIAIDNLCVVRAPHHPAPAEGLDLVITPKMSFGTGHHITTRLMIRHLFDLAPLSGRVLDVGCGTGVLAIAALKLGAESAVGVDVDEWAVENSRDNAALNGVEDRLEAMVGTVEVSEGLFELIVANIHLNILIHDLPDYVARLTEGGVLVMSGLLSSDREELCAAADACGLRVRSCHEAEGWVAISFVRK